MEDRAKIIDIRTNFNNQAIVTILFESRGIQKQLQNFLNTIIKNALVLLIKVPQKSFFIIADTVKIEFTLLCYF